ncbi:hypothetical protein [Bacillus wiedmannii]|uniref:hypothetical protein n=1 Tax=Bacillus wiedmannii TaxID=1890302 RepID=UPI000BEF4184|nr:hypothetical protein [Bacillus wiedmannii]PEK60050.1 hypothetical protein CN595_16145 [Bacillus wiedmannii]
MIKKSGEIIIPDFIEEEFICAMERYFSNSTVYPKNKELIKITRISQSKERERGYDGIITSIIPFYVQFKRSNFLTPKSTSKLITDREGVSLNTKQGVYCFPLHKNELEFNQHNTLYNLANHSHFKKKVFYAAPLFFRRNKLDDLRRGDEYAYRYRNYEIYDSMDHKYYNVERIPMFKNVMTIPPHKLVNKGSESHNYSFTKEGEVCFHSNPERYPENFIAQTLGDFLSSLNNEEPITEISNYADYVIKLLPEIFGLKFNTPKFKSLITTSINRSLNFELNNESDSTEKILTQLTPLDKLVIFEDVLKHHFNIHQYIRYSVLELVE